MSTQIDFDITINLLENYKSDYYFIDPLLDACRNSIVYFYAMHDSNGVMTKEHVLGVYTHRANLQNEIKPENPLEGYEELLSNIRNTKHLHIVPTTIGTEKNTAIIFTDIERQDIIGILYSSKVIKKQFYTAQKTFSNGKMVSTKT